MGKYRGCENVEFVSNGTQSDPDLIYNGHTFNYWDIDDALWSEFIEYAGYDDSDSGNPTVEDEFDKYVQDNAENYLEDCIFGGYFSDGSKSWHDRYSA